MIPPLTGATPDDVPALARLWHDAWHEAHANCVPAALIAERDLANFASRLAAMQSRVVMARDRDGPLGFCAVDTDQPGEVDQLFVAPHARGGGLAGRLLCDAEARLRAASCLHPHLYCIPGNARALRFYLRNGWQDCGSRVVRLTTQRGSFPLPCRLLRKLLPPS